MLHFLLILNCAFNVLSLPVGDGHFRIKRLARIGTGPDGWLETNLGFWNILYVVMWWYLGIAAFIYLITRCYISCCGILALAAATERSAKKFDEKDKSDSEIVHSITINVRRTGSEITPSTAGESSSKGILTARETQDRVILIPQIRQKLFTCREMSRRTVREDVGSRKLKPMGTAIGGRKPSVRVGAKTAIGLSKIGNKKSKRLSSSGKSTHSGTISGSSKVSTSSGSSSSSSSSSGSYSVNSTRSTRSGSKRSSLSRRSKRSSRGSRRSSRKSSKSSDRSHK